METASKPPTPALNKALAAAQKRAEAVEKDATNSFHKYRYASAEAIIAEARAALAEEGLAVMPVSTDRDPAQPDHVWKGEGADAFIDVPRRIRAVYLLLHESGEEREFYFTTPVIPEKGRPEDKAEFGSRTENLGYALRDLLLLPRVQEGAESPSARDDRGYQGPRQEPARGAKAAPPRSEPPKAEPPKAETAVTATTVAPDPEHAATLKKLRDIIGKDLGWEAKKATAWLKDVFGVASTAALSPLQAPLALTLAMAADLGDERYLEELAKLRAAHPALFRQEAAA